MSRFFALLALPSLCSCLVAPSSAAAGAMTGTWRAELVHEQAEPARELIVTGWYPRIEAGRRSHLVMLAPGRGIPASAYSRLVGFLLANDYAVVAVDSPGSGRQAFADGRHVLPDPALEPPDGLMAGPYIEVDRFFAAAAAAGAADLRFVLDRLQAGDIGPADIVPGAIDTRKVGVLGHSLGGRIAGAFAATDARVAAWIGVEGLAPRQARRTGLGVPALEILSDAVWPYAIANVRELAWCARHPTYFVRMDGVTHNTIVDDAPRQPGQGDLTNDQRRLAQTILAFLDAHLAAGGLVVSEWPAGVAAEHYAGPSGERPAELECRD